MSFWIPAPIENHPEVYMSRWKIIEATDDSGVKSRHFVGLDEFGGRVSSAIQKFDFDKRTGVTRSGRVYKLLGPPGHNADADYVWNAWKKHNKITEQTIIDIFEEINE
jgi:hypothetical protein